MGLKICSLASGSSGNATWISTGRTSVLVDCGTAAWVISDRLEQIGAHPSQLQGILITHAHTDHYRSAGTIHARFGVPVYIDPETARSARRRGQHTSWKRVREARPLPERIGDLEIEAIDTSHGFPPDEGRTVGFVLRHGRRKVAVVTDLGRVTDHLIARLRGVHAIVLEANHDEGIVRSKLEDLSFRTDWPYLKWVLGDLGHLSNTQCAGLLGEILDGGGAHVFLAHLSENHRDFRRDNNDYCRAQVAVREWLERRGLPVPHLHRTRRIGLEGTGPSDVVEI